jgi:conjugal transfer pilus assembly protein TraD
MNGPQSTLALAVCGLLFLAYGAPALRKVFPKLVALFPKFLNFRFKGEEGEIVLGGIRLNDQDRVRHTHIVGATGSGKTVLMESLIYEDLKRGRGALIIDPKGDRELYDRVKHFCEKIGRSSDLHYLSANSLEESVRWNPCRLGSVSEIQSKFLNTQVFTEPFYKMACECALLEAAKELTERGNFFMPDLVAVLESSSQKNKNIESLFNHFSSLVGSEWAEILCARPPNKTLKEINFLDITRRNEILFVDLPTEAKAVENSKIGRLLLQEIMLISGLRKTFPSLRSKTPFSVYVDEFDAFATESFATFQNKARSSNFMIHIAHQTLSDLKAIDEQFMGKILGNTNIRFIFRQDDPVDAETWANFFGTTSVLKQTFRTSAGENTGDASNRISKEFRIHPDVIKELAVGECIFSVKTSKRLQRLRVPPLKVERYFDKRPVERETQNYEVPVPKADPVFTNPEAT